MHPKHTRPSSDILWLNCDDNEFTFNKKNYLLRAAQRMELTCVRDFKTRENEPIDFLLNIEPYHFHGARLWCGVWEIDLLMDRPEYDPEVWRQVSDIFIAITGIPDKMLPYREKAIPLFHAMDTEIHYRHEEIKPKYDFVFAGDRGLQIYSERNRLIQLLQDNGFSFMDFNKNMKPWVYVEKVCEAKVQFARSIGETYQDTEAAQRVYEGLAIGPLLTCYSPELDYLFIKEGVDYFSYRNDNELITKMHYLIDHPEFANKMAENGRKKALMYHTYEHRVSALLNYLKKYDFAYW